MDSTSTTQYKLAYVLTNRRTKISNFMTSAKFRIFVRRHVSQRTHCWAATQTSYMGLVVMSVAGVGM